LILHLVPGAAPLAAQCYSQPNALPDRLEDYFEMAYIVFVNPAILHEAGMPLAGLAFGFIAYTLLKIARGKFRQVNWLVYALTLLFIARFVYLRSA
jgi:xanthine/uracil/vitamin C permease (AzgA family)